MLFMVSAVSASDIGEAVNIEINNDIVDEVIEVEEVIVEDIIEAEEVIVDEIIEVEEVDDTLSTSIDDADETIDSMVEDNHQVYNYTEISESYEKSFGVENSENQYNNTYIEEILHESLYNSSNSNLTHATIESYHIAYHFINDYEVLSCMKLDSIDAYDLSECEFKFDVFEGHDFITHEILIFYNNYCHVLTHAVNKNIILCDDKLNSGFVFCIDNSVLGSASNTYNNGIYSNLSFINYFSLSFSTSKHLLYDFYLNGCVYNFFSLLKNQKRGILLEFN